MTRRAWTTTDLATLTRMTAQGATLAAIAAELGRSKDSVAAMRTSRRKLDLKRPPRPLVPMAPDAVRVRQLVATIEREKAAARPRQAYVRELRLGLLAMVRRRYV